MKKFFIFMTAAVLSGCTTWNNLMQNWSWNSLNPWSETETVGDAEVVKESEKTEEGWFASWSWNSLNPWAEAEETKKTEEPQPQMLVNKYLWQASLAKLAFMGINIENPQAGKIITNWKSFPAATNERFKIIVKIDEGQELRADALHVEVYKEVNGKNGWMRTVSPEAVQNKIEQAIIAKAKMLYINDYEEL